MASVEPFVNYRFKVTSTGETALNAQFTSVTGMGGNAPVDTYQPANQLDGPIHVANPPTGGEATFSSGMTREGNSVEGWWLETQEILAEGGNSNQLIKTIRVELLDRNGRTLKNWYLREARLISYTPGALDANSPGILIEEFTVAYRGFEIRS